jgi:hypothetical protein
MSSLDPNDQQTTFCGLLVSWELQIWRRRNITFLFEICGFHDSVSSGFFWVATSCRLVHGYQLEGHNVPIFRVKYIGSMFLRSVCNHLQGNTVSPLNTSIVQIHSAVNLFIKSWLTRLEYIPPKGTTLNKQSAVAYFKALFRNLATGTEKNHKNVSVRLAGLRAEAWTPVFPNAKQL